MRMPVMISMMLLCGIALGYEVGIFPTVVNSLTHVFHLDNTLIPIVAASPSLAAAFAAIISGFLADRFGRRAFLVAAFVLFMLGVLESSIAESVSEFIVSRVLFGCSVGMMFVLIPLYIIELSPANRRGRAMASFFLAINIGVFLACFVGFLTMTLDVWRFLIVLGFFPITIVCLGFWGIPESPRWLAQQTAAPSVPQSRPVTLWDERGIRILLIGMIINIFAQAVGVHAIAVYATLTMHNISAHDGFSSLTSNIMIAFSLMTGTFLAVRVIDTFPRRRLLLLGMSGMTTSLVLLSWALQHPMDVAFMTFIVLVSCALFVGCQGFSLAPMASLLPGELFPQSLRGVGMGICSAVYWITNTIVVYAFPHMLIEYGAAVSFLVFLFFTLIAWVWFYFNIPETSQVSLETLEQHVQEGRHNRDLGVEDVFLELN